MKYSAPNTPIASSKRPRISSKSVFYVLKIDAFEIKNCNF
jgi:hypothetical protein